MLIVVRCWSVVFCSFVTQSCTCGRARVAEVGACVVVMMCACHCQTSVFLFSLLASHVLRVLDLVDSVVL